MAVCQASLPFQDSNSSSNPSSQGYARFLGTMQDGMRPPYSGQGVPISMRHVSEGHQFSRTINGNQMTERREQFRSVCRHDGVCHRPTSRTHTSSGYEHDPVNELESHGHGQCIHHNCHTASQPVHTRPPHPQHCTGAHYPVHPRVAHHVPSGHHYAQCTGRDCHSATRAGYAHPRHQHYCTGQHCQAVGPHDSDDEWTDFSDYDSDSEYYLSGDEHINGPIIHEHW